MIDAYEVRVAGSGEVFSDRPQGGFFGIDFHFRQVVDSGIERVPDGVLVFPMGVFDTKRTARCSTKFVETSPQVPGERPDIRSFGAGDPRSERGRGPFEKIEPIDPDGTGGNLNRLPGTGILV